MDAPTKKRGRPAKVVATPEPVIEIQEKIVEVIKEVIRTVEVEKPRLEDYALYSHLRDTGFPQGGSGVYMENPTGMDKAYVPTAPEVLSYFAANPEEWEDMRDGIIRTYIEIKEKMNQA